MRPVAAQGVDRVLALDEQRADAASRVQRQRAVQRVDAGTANPALVRQRPGDGEHRRHRRQQLHGLSQRSGLDHDHVRLHVSPAEHRVPVLHGKTISRGMFKHLIGPSAARISL